MAAHIRGNIDSGVKPGIVLISLTTSDPSGNTKKSTRAFEAVGCEGLARVDFFLMPDGSLVVNELNTMPGFTPLSMFPQMWAATGVPYADLVDRLLTLALNRETGLR